MNDSRQPTDGWDADLDALLDQERARGGLPHDSSNRIRARVMTSVGVAAGVGIATGAASASAKAATSVASAGAKAAVTTSSVVAGTTTVVAPKVIATVAAAILVGGASGAIVMNVLTPPRTPTQAKVHATRVVDEGSSPHSLRAPGVAPPVEIPSVEPELAADEPASEAPQIAAAPIPVVRPASRDHDLASERELLAQARGAVSFRRFQDALDLLDQHRRKFARGRLSEERDSLRVTALAMLGRHDAARDAARHFHARYPESIFAQGVKQAVASIP